MNNINFETSLLIFFGFALLMYLLLFLTRRRGSHNTAETFYVADRKVNTFQGALSIAISWIWAPALFVASSISYELGIWGAIWFIVPNVLCFFVFAPIAIKFREKVPNGYTLPGFFKEKFPNKQRLWYAFMVTTSLYALTAIIENLVAVSKLYTYYTGFAGWYAILLMTIITLSYSLISGLRASILTDVLQMLMVVVIGFILVPWVLNTDSIGLKFESFVLGSNNAKLSILAIAISPGLSLLFGLIGGPMGDQMFFQRAMAIPKRKLKKTLFIAGGVFAIVPITMSILGFIGKSAANLNVFDTELVGAIVIDAYLPRIGGILFFILALGGLASTLDSAYCAFGSVSGREFFSKIMRITSEKREVNLTRIFIILFAFIGALLASISRDIWYVFMVDAAIASSVILPVLGTVFYAKQSENSTFWTLISGLSIGIFIAVLGQIMDIGLLASLGAPLSVFVGLLVTLTLNYVQKN